MKFICGSLNIALLGTNIAPKRGGFAAPVVLSYELSQFMGERIVPRTQVTKRLWDYIKEHNLQNPNNRKEILCDEVLQKVLKRKKVMMFQMTKIVSTVRIIR